MTTIQIPYHEVAIDQGVTVLDSPEERAPAFVMDYAGFLQLADVSTWTLTETSCAGIDAYWQAVDRSLLYGEADRIATRIVAIAHDAMLRDENEPAPPQAVIDESTRLIREVANRMINSMPPAQVATFFGEVNVTWKFGNQVVRLAFFPNRPSVLQIGSIAMPVGSYQSQTNPTPELVAERLNPFTTQNDPEDSPSPG